MLLGAVATILLGTLTAQFMRQRLPVSYRVGVVGFPRAGKTTMITSMFGAMFTRKLAAFKGFYPRGSSTIERVNADLEKLELRQSLGPTADQDRFGYRIDVVRSAGFIPQTYKVEIGDFPGEDSVKFTEQYGDWLHQTDYFKWVMDCDAWIFVIDLEPVVPPHVAGMLPAVGPRAAAQVARSSRAIRAAWQKLQEYHLDGGRPLSEKPLALVFTKADLLLESGSESKKTTSETREGFRPLLSQEELRAAEDQVEQLFADLISYLKSQTQNFQVLFVSAFAFEGDGGRLGIGRLLKHILPHGRSWKLSSLVRPYAWRRRAREE